MGKGEREYEEGQKLTVSPPGQLKRVGKGGGKKEEDALLGFPLFNTLAHFLLSQGYER